MAKQKVESDKFLLVTEANRRHSIVMGRKLHVFDDKWTELGKFEIRPRLTPGWMEFGPHKCFVTQEENREDYARSFDEVITYLIKRKQLYIAPKEHIVEFKQSNKKK